MTSSPTAVAGGDPFTLPDVRTLTDAPTITRLLHSTIAHERQTLTHLSTLLTPSPSSPIPFPSSLPALSSSLLASLSSTADLALSSTATVRRLHLAISRLDEALSFLDRSVVRSRCLKVAREAVEVEDLETAAEAVREFVGTGPGEGERERIEEVRKRVEGSARKRVREAVERREHKDVVRYLEIFPKLGLEEDALQIYVSYLRKVIADRSSFDFDSEKDVDFVGCLTGLFKDVVLAVEENDGMLRGFCGEHGIVYAVCELQEVCDSKGSVIVKKYMEYRKLSKLAAEINSYSKSLLLVGVGGEMKGPDPRIVENYLEEILTLTQLGEDYTEFMVAKIRGLTSVDPELGPKVIKMLRSGSFSRVVQDITGFYVILEEFFMVENVRKAIAIDEQIPDSLTTSMVDDVFYVLQSCCRRAVSTGNANSVLAVLSGAVNLLGNEYQEALQQKMREPNLGAKLFLGGVGVQKTGTEVATALNNMDVSSEYVLKLRHEIEEQCSEMFPLPADREKVKSCITELGEMSNNLKQVLNAGLEQLLTTITPRIRPVLDNVGTISYELTESEYEDYEVNDPWVQNVLHAVEINIAWLQPVMTTNNYDSLVHLVIDFIVKRLEVIMMQKRFSPLGSLQLDRDTRALVNHFYNMTQRPVRDKFARLTQMTTILNIEKVSEILDFWGENSGTMTWRLTPAEVRRVLGLRIDFKPEAIAALKL